MRSLAIMAQFAPVVFDATALGPVPSISHGDDGQLRLAAVSPSFFPCYRGPRSRRAWTECLWKSHDNPKEAKSDGANALDSRNLRGY